MAQAQQNDSIYPQEPDAFTKRVKEADEKQREEQEAEERRKEFEGKSDDDKDELDPLGGSPIEFKPKIETDDGDIIDEMKEQFTLEAFLRDAPFPATKEQLMAFAQGRGCGAEILGFIQSLPDNLNQYDNPNEIAEVLEGNELSEEELVETAKRKPDAYTQRVKKAEEELEKAKREEEQRRQDEDKEDEPRLEKE